MSYSDLRSEKTSFQSYQDEDALSPSLHGRPSTTVAVWNTPLPPFTAHPTSTWRNLHHFSTSHTRRASVVRALATFGTLLLLACTIFLLSLLHVPSPSLPSPLRPYPVSTFSNGDITPLRTLDPSLLPTQENGRRLIVVGDVHGCRAQLEELLNVTNFNRERDHLVLTGDTIAKGPDAKGVLDLIRDIGASPVRGNHEDRLIRRAREMGRFDNGPHNATMQDGKQGKAVVVRKVENPGAEELARTLPLEDLNHIRSFPVMLDLGHLSMPDSLEMNTTVRSVVVHGGLMPGLRLEEQDLGDVMEMRTLARKEVQPQKHGKNKHNKLKQWRWVASPEPEDGEKWHNVWGVEQDLAYRESLEHPPTSLSTSEGTDVSPSEAHQLSMTSRPLWSGSRLPDFSTLYPRFGRDTLSKHRDGRWKKGGPGGEIDEHIEAMRCIYGHDSKLGLVRRKWSTGLDGACVRGGRLYALVIEAGAKERMVGVDCSSLAK